MAIHSSAQKRDTDSEDSGSIADDLALTTGGGANTFKLDSMPIVRLCSLERNLPSTRDSEMQKTVNPPCVTVGIVTAAI